MKHRSSKKPKDNKLVLSRLQTNALVVDERLDAWRASCSHIFDANVRNCDERDGFFAEIGAYNLDELVIIDTKSVGQAFQRNTALRVQEELDHFLVQLYLEGGYFGEHAGKVVHVHPGDIGILDLASNLKTETTGNRFRCLSVFVPRHLLVSVVPNSNALGGTVISKNSAMGRLLKAHLLSVWDVLPDTRTSEVSVVSDSLLTMLGAALTQQEGLSGQAEQVRNQAQTVQIQDHIEAHLTDPDLNTTSLCKAFNCSRSHLYRLLEPLGGVTGYITERRLARAYRDLLRSDNAKGRISAMAFGLGFNSQSHFSRLFRKHFGLSPSDVIDIGTQQAISDTTYAEHEADNNGLPDWHYWIRGL